MTDHKLPTETATSLTVDLLNLDASFQDRKFRSLLEAGYRIAQILPAEDNGRSIAIFIFEPPARQKSHTIDPLLWRAVLAAIIMQAGILATLCAALYLLINGV